MQVGPGAGRPVEALAAAEDALANATTQEELDAAAEALVMPGGDCVIYKADDYKPDNWDALMTGLGYPLISTFNL